MRILSPAPLRPFFVSFALLLVVPLAAQLAAAQSPPTRKAPPPPPPPPAKDQQQFLSYWTTETGWRTELQLRNNQVGLTLTVTPVLRTADGTETALPSVVVQPQEVKSIDLATAIGDSAPQLIGTYGSAVLRFRAPSLANLYAVSMVMGVGHSVAFHIDAAGEDQTQDVGTREGIWWLPNGAASDFLILVNHGQNPLQLSLSLFDATGKPSHQRVALPPRSMNRLSIRPLVAAAGLAGSFGGIKVSAAARAGSLDTLHVLFDSEASFSAVLKMFDYDPRAQLKERDYAATGQWTLRAPMLALSSPDPALAFPVGTVLKPQLFIRNTTAKSIDASLTFNWRSDDATGKASGPALHLSPHETRRIDVAALQDGKEFPQNAQWASVTLATTAMPDEVVAVAASYDATLRYGTQTPFSDQLSGHWVGGQWQYDTQHDSIITAGNGSAQPTQAGFTIFYNQGAQKYQLVQTLQPGEQMWMDIGKLIREQVPDKDGKTLPANLTSGSYEVRDLNNKAAASLFEGKVVYDRTYGHVTYGCAACCGYTDPIVNWYDPLSVFFQGIADDGVNGWYPCESQYDDISAFFFNHWSSSNTGIVTVDYYGTHTGVAVGSTTTQTFAPVPTNNPHLRCPTLTQHPSGGANVNGITVHFNGSLSSGDNLSFSNVAQTCSSTLGLKDCSTSYPSAWVWNVEIEADVFDDAANYTVSQGVTGSASGLYRASNGTLQSFSTSTNKPAPQDNPPSAVLQQVSGQKVIFWLDAPGRGTIYTDANNPQNSGPIDSMTEAKNFISSICSTANPSNCWRVNWYVKIVVKSGGTLDTANSKAGFGTAP